MAPKKNRNKNKNLKQSNENNQKVDESIDSQEELVSNNTSSPDVKLDDVTTTTTIPKEEHKEQLQEQQVQEKENQEEVQIEKIQENSEEVLLVKDVNMGDLFLNNSQQQQQQQDEANPNSEFSTLNIGSNHGSVSDSIQSNLLSLGDSFTLSSASLNHNGSGSSINGSTGIINHNNHEEKQQHHVMKELLEFLEIYKTSNVNLSNSNNNNTSDQDWKSLYFTVSKQLNLERSKTETLENLIQQRDSENQTLKDQIKLLEIELVGERKKLNKTVGTLRNNSKKLTVKLGNNIDVQSILEELNQGLDQSISTSNTITEGLVTIMNGANNNEFTSDQLLNRLNTLKSSSTHSSSYSLLSTSKNSTISFSSQDIKKITIVQTLVRRWLAKKIFKKLKLTNLNILETKRSVIAELFETERTYVSRIKDLLKIFVNPLKQRIKNDPILQADEIDSIFSSINMIYKCNSIFLDRIEEIYLKFNKWSCFGEKVLEQIPLFECYIDYIINFEYAQKTLKKLKSTSKALQEFVKVGENKPELDDLDIGDLMIMPVQRIPRYIMLFREIRKYTPIHHNDYQSIDKALEAFKMFALSINEKSGARKKCLQLEDRIIGYKDDLTSNSRYLVREGALKFKKNNEYVFLFNDMILICHPNLKKTKSKTMASLPVLNDRSSGNLGATLSTKDNINMTSSTSSTSSSGNNSANSSSTNVTSPNSSPSFSRSAIDNVETETTFKFISKINLDARVKIVQDPVDPKFLVIIPDDSRVEFIASSLEERLHWVQDIMMIVSVFSSHILNQPILDNNNEKL